MFWFARILQNRKEQTSENSRPGTSPNTSALILPDARRRPRRAFFLPPLTPALNEMSVLNQNVTARIAALEIRADRCDETRADVELRLRKIEQAIYFATGALAVLQVVLKFL